jgi:SAM-dependent methyltransferase
MIQPYDRIAAEWAAARVALRAQDRPLLDRMIEGLPPGAEVLDLGCGTGRPNAEYLVAKGFRVTGVDQSSAMLTKARAWLPQCEWIEAELDAVTPGRVFSAVLCWDALFHLERARHQQVLTLARQVLPSGGRFLFSTGGSAHPPFWDTMWGHEFFYDAHAPDEMIALTARTGFRILATVMVDPPTGGRDKGKLAILAEKP